MVDLTPATGSVIGAVAAVTLETLGIEVPPLVWSFVGAALMQGYAEVTVSRGKAAVQLFASSILGAIIGLNAFLLPQLFGIELPEKLTPEQVQLGTYLLCALGGFGAHPLMKKVLSRVAGDTQESGR